MLLRDFAPKCHSSFRGGHSGCKNLQRNAALDTNAFQKNKKSTPPGIEPERAWTFGMPTQHVNQLS